MGIIREGKKDLKPIRWLTREELAEELGMSLEGVREISAGLEQSHKDAQYFHENYESLRRKYPDMYVAIYKGKVIDADTNHGRLCDRLHESGKMQPTKYQQCVIERTYFEEKPPVFILPQFAV